MLSYIILAHYHDYHYHHSAMVILYLSQELHWGMSKETHNARLLRVCRGLPLTEFLL